MKYKARKRMFALLCLVVIMASLTCTALAATEYEVYTKSGLGANLREDHSVSADVICTLSNGTTVSKTTSYSWSEDGYTWYKVKVTSGTYEGERGYIAADYLSYIG